MTSFFTDESAAIEIPIRLLVYVILTFAIVAVTIIGFSHIYPGMTANIMEKQIGEIKVTLDAMQNGGSRNLIDPDSPGGNIRTIIITIPDEVDFLAFGSDPDPDNDLNLTNTPEGVITGRGNVIFYSSVKNGKIGIPLNDGTEIREGLFENGRWVVNEIGGKQYGVVISGKGNYELTFEMVYDPLTGERYTLVHMTDDLNAYINPYDPQVLPNNLWISVYPTSLPADGLTYADVFISLKDKKGRDAPVDRVRINLSASIGNLSLQNLMTVKGKASARIRSDIAGTSMITATSPGLNPGSVHLTIIPVPIILEFNRWIYNEDEGLNGQFFTSQDSNYTISFTGYGTKFSVPLLGTWWPDASIEIDGVKLAEERIDFGSNRTITFSQARLPAGDHHFNISLKNDKYFPFVGDTNIYVVNVVLSW